MSKREWGRITSHGPATYLVHVYHYIEELRVVADEHEARLVALEGRLSEHAAPPTGEQWEPGEADWDSLEKVQLDAYWSARDDLLGRDVRRSVNEATWRHIRDTWPIGGRAVGVLIPTLKARVAELESALSGEATTEMLNAGADERRGGGTLSSIWRAMCAARKA